MLIDEGAYLIGEEAVEYAKDYGQNQLHHQLNSSLGEEPPLLPVLVRSVERVVVLTPLDQTIHYEVEVHSNHKESFDEPSPGKEGTPLFKNTQIEVNGKKIEVMNGCSSLYRNNLKTIMCLRLWPINHFKLSSSTWSGSREFGIRLAIDATQF